MPAVGQHEAPLAAQQLRGAVHRIPRRDVVVDPGHAEAVHRDLLQVDRRAAHLQASRMAQRVVLEEIQQVAMQSGGQARVVVVPVEDVERGRLLAQQVVVDPVVPDQVIGAHPGEHPRHVAAVEYALLVGAALGRFQGLLVDEQRGRAVDLAVEQAHQVAGAGDAPQLALGLQVALQGGDGQAAGAGAHQVDFAGAGDRPAHVERLFEGGDVGGQAPFAVSHIRVAPADHKGLQAVFQGVLHKAVGRAQVENVVLVDLRRHDQQRLGVLFFAHGLVLDQLQ